MSGGTGGYWDFAPTRQVIQLGKRVVNAGHILRIIPKSDFCAECSPARVVGGIQSILSSFAEQNFEVLKELQEALQKLQELGEGLSWQERLARAFWLFPPTREEEQEIKKAVGARDLLYRKVSLMIEQGDALGEILSRYGYMRYKRVIDEIDRVRHREQQQKQARADEDYSLLRNSHVRAQNRAEVEREVLREAFRPFER